MSLQQSLPFREDTSAQDQPLSLLQGPVDPPLVDYTLGELLDLQCLHYGTQECLVIPWTGARWTYNELNQQSRMLANALLATGLGPGDRVGIMAGNCEQYAAVFFAAARIGAVLAILNNTYSATEALRALKFTGTKPCPSILFGLPSRLMNKQNVEYSSQRGVLDDLTTRPSWLRCQFQGRKPLGRGSSYSGGTAASSRVTRILSDALILEIPVAFNTPRRGSCPTTSAIYSSRAARQACPRRRCLHTSESRSIYFPGR